MGNVIHQTEQKNPLGQIANNVKKSGSSKISDEGSKRFNEVGEVLITENIIAEKLETDENVINAILGRHAQIEERRRVLQVFLSSTFTDTKIERDSLIQNVFPYIREFCTKRGFEFLFVDMRWGVRDESTADHLTTELCAKQIEKCRERSCGIHFISLLDQKYGYRPPPRLILETDFNEILTYVSDEVEKNLLLSVYKLDQNRVPHVYELQPRQVILDMNLKLIEESSSSSSWDVIFDRIVSSLRKAVFKSNLSDSKKRVFFQSVTEDEIRRGFLDQQNSSSSSSSNNNNNNNNDKVVWFHRKLLDEDKIDKYLSNHSDSLRKYIDMSSNGEILIEEQNLLKELKEKMKEKLNENYRN